jgi:hypothetical protein
MAFVICRNPDLAEEQREQHQRDMAEIEKELEVLKALKAQSPPRVIMEAK